jgi:hypothetical protein
MNAARDRCHHIWAHGRSDAISKCDSLTLVLSRAPEGEDWDRGSQGVSSHFIPVYGRMSTRMGDGGFVGRNPERVSVHRGPVTV